jgi:hypothetical protein
MNKLIVSEPWDFCFGDSENVAFGEVVRRFESGALLFKLSHPISLNGREGAILYLSLRFHATVSLNDRAEGIEYNGNIVGDIDALTAEETEIVSNSTFSLIGSLFE